MLKTRFCFIRFQITQTGCLAPADFTWYRVLKKTWNISSMWILSTHFFSSCIISYNFVTIDFTHANLIHADFPQTPKPLKPMTGGIANYTNRDSSPQDLYSIHNDFATTQPPPLSSSPSIVHPTHMISKLFFFHSLSI